MRTETNVRWGSVFSLAMLDACVAISWMVYHSFQPKLIERFHFEHLSGFVQIAQALIILFVPLLAGILADRIRAKNGNNFNVFAIGISIASMVFMSVAFTISDQTFINLQWLLPIMIILWLVSMNIFHSPANAVLEEFTYHSFMPYMMAVIAIAKMLVHVFRPLIVDTTQNLGGAITFAAGGALLIGSGILFYFTSKETKSTEAHASEHKARYFNIVLYGFLAGLANSLLLHYFPTLLTTRFGEIHSVFHEHFYVSLTLVISALLSLPAAWLATRKGTGKILSIGLCVVFAGMIPVLLDVHFMVNIIALVIMAVGYSLISVTAFPYALYHVSAKHATLGVGVFFGSYELFEIIMSFIHH